MATVRRAQISERALMRLLSHVPLLERIADEQQTLQAGSVTPRESRHRLAIANRVNVACQLLELGLAGGEADEPVREPLRAVRALAELVLRENPVLQARGPLAVIRSSDVPRRHVVNRDRRREIRKGYGLHRGVRNEEGPSVVIAFTPPGYEQLWHSHTVDEYTLALDTQFEARYMDGGVRALGAADGDLLHFTPHTYHTLANRGVGRGRTLTLKYPLGMSVWVPGLRLTGRESGSATVLSTAWNHGGEGMLIRRFGVMDAHHRYTINLADLAPHRQMDLSCDEAAYFYVLDGAVNAAAGNREVTASADDVIAVDPTRSLRVQADRYGSRLYWVSDVVFTEDSGGVPYRAA